MGMKVEMEVGWIMHLNISKIMEFHFNLNIHIKDMIKNEKLYIIDLN